MGLISEGCCDCINFVLVVEKKFNRCFSGKLLYLLELLNLTVSSDVLNYFSDSKTEDGFLTEAQSKSICDTEAWSIVT